MIRKGFGAKRIRQEMGKKGLRSSSIQRILSESVSEADEREGAEHILKKHIKKFERENDLKLVSEKLTRKGFAADCVHTVFRPRKKDIATEIINLARESKFDTIVLNRKATRVTRFFSGSVSNKVMMTLKDTTVCIVS